MSRSPEQDERLADWVDGNLSAKDLERFEAELRVNPELAAAAAEYQDFVHRIQRELQFGFDAEDMESNDTDREHSAEDTAQREELSDRIMAGLPESEAKVHRFPMIASIAAAAAITLVYIGMQVLPRPEATKIGDSTRFDDRERSREMSLEHAEKTAPLISGQSSEAPDSEDMSLGLLQNTLVSEPLGRERKGKSPKSGRPDRSEGATAEGTASSSASKSKQWQSDLQKQVPNDALIVQEARPQNPAVPTRDPKIERKQVDNKNVTSRKFTPDQGPVRSSDALTGPVTGGPSTPGSAGPSTPSPGGPGSSARQRTVGRRGLLGATPDPSTTNPSLDRELQDLQRPTAPSKEQELEPKLQTRSRLGSPKSKPEAPVARSEQVASDEYFLGSSKSKRAGPGKEPEAVNKTVLTKKAQPTLSSSSTDRLRRIVADLEQDLGFPADRVQFAFKLRSVPSLQSQDKEDSRPAQQQGDDSLTLVIDLPYPFDSIPRAKAAEQKDKKYKFGKPQAAKPSSARPKASRLSWPAFARAFARQPTLLAQTRSRWNRTVDVKPIVIDEVAAKTERDQSRETRRAKNRVSDGQPSSKTGQTTKPKTRQELTSGLDSKKNPAPREALEATDDQWFVIRGTEGQLREYLRNLAASPSAKTAMNDPLAAVIPMQLEANTEAKSGQDESAKTKTGSPSERGDTSEAPRLSLRLLIRRAR